MSAHSSVAASKVAAAPWPTSALEAGVRARRLVAAATQALYDELCLYPKPGLVSFVDCGSHVDMDARTFMRSIFALREYFRAIAELGAGNASFADLERLGIAAEQRMLVATGGANTHRGAIFTLGILCAAAGGDEYVGAGVNSAAVLRERLVARWGAALAARVEAGGTSNGERARRHHGVRGARAEAAAGFATLFDIAVPTLRNALERGLDRRRAHLQTLFAVLATLEDTNLVHRGGRAGLRFAHAEAKHFLAAGGAFHADALARAEATHRRFVARGLSPGGAADMLAAACWVVRVCG